MNRFLAFIGVLLMLCCSSCIRYYYRPNAVNAPLLADKGDIHAGAAAMFTSTKEEKTSILDVQAAYSPLKHLGIIAGYSNNTYKTTVPIATIGRVNSDWHLLEAGAGYYYSFGKKIRTVADIYAGAGSGKVTSDVSMTGTKFFIQPGIGVRYKFLDASFNIRFTGIKYTSFNANGKTDSYLHQQDLTDNQGRRIDERIFWFYEPCITIRGGYKFVKLQVQAVYSKKMSAFDWYYSPGRVTGGIYLNIEEFISVLKASQSQ